MTDHERLLRVFAENNPVPSEDEVASASAHTLTSIRERRSEPVTDMKTVRPVDTKPKQPQRGWLIAAAASAAVVIVAVVIGSLLVNGDDAAPVPPAADPSTTVEQPATTDQEALDVAEALIAANNAGDLDAYMDHYAEDARVFTYDLGTEYDAARDFQGFFLAKGTRFEGTCEAAGGRVTCVGTFPDSLTEAIGSEPDQGTWTLSVVDGKVQSVTYSGTNNALAANVAIWTATNRPDFWVEHFEDCLSDRNCERLPGANFLMTPEAGAALVEILPEYLADGS